VSQPLKLIKKSVNWFSGIRSYFCCLLILHLILLLNSMDSYSMQTDYHSFPSSKFVRLTVASTSLTERMYDAKWYKHSWLFVNDTFSSRHTMLRKQWLHYEKIQFLKADTASFMTQNPPWWANILSLLANKCYAFYLFPLVQITAHYQN